MNVINFNQYKRAFFFGCSFTKFYWPTWADILSKEIKETYNYAKIGAGNFFIFQSIIEAIVTHKIGKDDLVLVMLSNITREDRYTKKDGWITPGNLYFQDIYDIKFMDKFFCERGFLLRDLNLIEGIIRCLDSLGVDYKLMSIAPINYNYTKNRNTPDVDDIIRCYASTLDKISPSVYEIIFNNDWNSKPIRPKYTCVWHKGLYVDNHPTPQEHYEFLCKTFPNTVFAEDTLDYINRTNKILLSCTSHEEIVKSFENEIARPVKRL